MVVLSLLRKAAGLSRSFTSRLKSIANHKQEESVSSTEYDGSFDDNLESPVVRETLFLEVLPNS